MKYKKPSKKIQKERADWLDNFMKSKLFIDTLTCWGLTKEEGKRFTDVMAKK